MPTWDDTRAHLARRYRLRRSDASGVEMSWRFPGAHELQLQTVEPQRAMARAAAVVRCELGGAAMPLQDALVHNSTLAFGALAFADGAYVLRHVVLLDGLAWSALDEVLEVIAHEAARLRRRPVGPTSTACFLHLVD